MYFLSYINIQSIININNTEEIFIRYRYISHDCVSQTMDSKIFVFFETVYYKLHNTEIVKLFAIENISD